tara:strand:- start:826 stop:1350 length:525 start_codon:yes stop_codon:yes gene_type:complete
MSPSDYQRLLTFFKLSGELKKQIRTGWLLKAKIDQPESVADHVFRTTLIAMILGSIKKLDLCKLLEMAILHDLDEVITGDLLPEEKDNINSNLFNDNLLTFLPAFFEQRYSKLYQEIKNETSPESKLLKQIDHFEMAIQAKEYSELSPDESSLIELYDSAKKKINDELLIKMLE